MDHSLVEVAPSEFPDENPNPVMRISKQGKLLYANTASEILLSDWQQIPEKQLSNHIITIVSTVLQTETPCYEDFICGEQVFTVCFAPLKGAQVVNVYALDTTRQHQVERSLTKALQEVEQLKHRLQLENDYLHEELKLVQSNHSIIGNSEVLMKVLQQIKKVARTDSTVLVLGETGTGKELLARAIHQGSPRKDRQLVKVNCAALPVNLIESELFGHVKGAFTGAHSNKIGRFELADGGTIFLDEIGDLPLDVQSQLLRVLQEGELERVGSSKTIKINVRVIAATNHDLAQKIVTGDFREDLFYRLNVFPITSPPLRLRKQDISLLAHHFLQRYRARNGSSASKIDAATIQTLKAYDWPGNVRELQNIIERAAILSDGDLLQLDGAFELHVVPNKSVNKQKTLKQVEREMIQLALEQSEWKIEGSSGAAQSLDMAPSTLREKIRKYGIQRHLSTPDIRSIATH
jgi:formate hydrogenlyase transcriptional activator